MQSIDLKWLLLIFITIIQWMITALVQLMYMLAYSIHENILISGT